MRDNKGNLIRAGYISNALKETTTEKIYFLHSPNDIDGTEKKGNHADDAKLIKEQYSHIVDIELVQINGFEMNNIFQIIDQIIQNEIESSDYELDPMDFAVNLSGGTKIMTTGAIIGTLMTGAKAYYVHDDRFKTKRKEYLEWLPIPSYGMLKNLNGKKLEVLRTLANGKFVNLKTKETQVGVMKRQDLATKLNMHLNTLDSNIGVLKKQGLVDIEYGYYENKEKNVGFGKKENVLKFYSKGVLHKITPLGRMRSKMNSLKPGLK